MADAHDSSVQRGRGLLALNITNARSFLQCGSSKQSRPVTVCGINWKLEVERREATVDIGRKKVTSSRIAAKILYTVNDAQTSIHVKAKCRIRVRHATANDLKTERINALSFDAKTDDAELERKFYEQDWLAGIE
ncbi:hypothetical protein AAVH_36514, partial [Aphelenchoides avenae]